MENLVLFLLGIFVLWATKRDWDRGETDAIGLSEHLPWLSLSRERQPFFFGLFVIFSTCLGVFGLFSGLSGLRP